ncbi:MAG: EF-hand domain-containing protein [Planctomycetes bacterium]|nr:EF-hand domain-containing protein [Planctomycetota bacterium]
MIVFQSLHGSWEPAFKTRKKGDTFMVSGINSTGGYMGIMNTQTMQQRRDELFNKIDSSGDGSLDKTEFSAFAQKLAEKSGNTLNAEDVFSTYDADGDGALSKDEVDSFMKDNAPPPPSSGIGGYTAVKNTRSKQQHQDDLFNKIDSSGDGGIDKSEFESFAEKISERTGNSIDAEEVFSTYDEDGDGSLSKDEVENFMKDNAPPPPSDRYSKLSVDENTSSLINVVA